MAIFQLLQDTEHCLPQLGLVAFGLGCANAPLALLLICSALFRLPCGLGLWLTASIIQFCVIGLPVFVYCFILIVYVALQMKLYVEASCAASVLGLFYLLALIVWLTVLGCYHQMKQAIAFNYYSNICLRVVSKFKFNFFFQKCKILRSDHGRITLKHSLLLRF